MKTIFCIISLLITVSLSAQTTKGSLLLGGSISFSHTENEYSGSGSQYKSNFFSFQPNVGIFLFKNFAVGLTVPVSLSRSTSKSTYNTELRSKSRSLGVGPSVRYYIPIANSLSVYAAGAYMWATSRTEFPGFDPGTGDPAINGNIVTNTRNTYQIGVGLAYFLNQHTSLDLLVAYSGANDDSIDTKAVNLGLGLQIFLPSRKE